MYRLQVKLLAKRGDTPFVQIYHDLRQMVPDGTITIEAGPTVTGPLYEVNPETGKLSCKTPVDTLYLTRYKGPIDPEAVGPKFSNVRDLEKGYEQVSSEAELTEDMKAIWTF
jgi:hypothetical protein